MTAPFDPAVRRTDWLWVGLLSLLVFAVAHRHGFLSAYVINDDVRQQLYWMARWLDPALYPPDLLGDYAAGYVPVGVKALYFSAVRGLGIEPILFSKLLSGGLFLVLALSLFGLGVALEGRTLGYFAVVTSWLLPFFLKNISGGLSRSFAAPLLALFLLAWMRKSDRGMAVILILQAIFIPYIAVVSAGCACLDALLARLTDRAGAPFPARPWHALALVATAGMVWSFNHALRASGFGPLVGGDLLATWPEFTMAGRLELYPLPNPFFDLIYWPFESIGLFLEIGLVAGIVSLVVLLPFVIVGARRTPWKRLVAKAQPPAMLLAGSLGLYVLARAIALQLFVPDRYISYTINLLYALLLAIILRHALGSFFSRPGVGMAALIFAAGLGAWCLSDVGLYDYKNDAPLYAAVGQTEKSALFAGNPILLDNVLTFGRRNVLASFELAHPWSLGYWEQMLPRLAHQVDAYYAKDPGVVLEFARVYGVTHFVVREADFEPEALAGHPLFAPFDARIRELAGRAGKFALLDGEKFPYTSPEVGMRLVDLRFLLNQHGTAAQ